MSKITEIIIFFWRLLTALRSVFNIIFVIIVVLGFLTLFSFLGDYKSIWPFLLVLFLIVGFVIGLNTIGLKIGLSQKPQEGEKGENPFVGSLSLRVETKRDFNKTQLSPGEKILAWLAPVDGTNWQRANYALGKEVVAAAENVLILTNRQLIGIALLQEDLDQIRTNSLISLVQSVNTINPSASKKQFWLMAANLGIFPKYMEMLGEDKLEKLLSSRWQFGVNLSQIKKVEPKKTFFNAGVSFHLKDGRVYHYKIIWRKQIDQFVEAVRKTGTPLAF